MRIRRANQCSERVGPQLTPMLGIVLLLLVFFAMTFRAVLPEGDLRIDISRASAAEYSEHMPPLKLRLRTDADGELSGMALNGLEFGTDFDALRDLIIQLVGNERGPGSIAEAVELKIACDYGLKYEYLIDAITAVSGYVAPDGHIVPLLEKVRFVSPKKDA